MQNWFPYRDDASLEWRREPLRSSVHGRLGPGPEPIDLVDFFRRPEHTPEVARAAVAVGALWLQLGIAGPEARAIAEEAGLRYVEDRCLLVVGREHSGAEVP